MVQEEGMKVKRDTMDWHENPCIPAKEFGLTPVGSQEPLKDLQKESDMIRFASSFRWLCGRTSWRGVQDWSQGTCQVVFQVLTIPLCFLYCHIEWSRVTCAS